VSPSDFDVLERWIRELQIEWEKFFTGIERKPPTELKNRVEALVRKYAGADLRNNAERFRYQSLTARYSSLSELWNRRLRAVEEGRPITGVRAPHPVPPPPVPAAEPGPRERPLAPKADPVRVTRGAEDAAVRQLYDRFVAARRASGEDGAVRYESFQRLVAQQAERILASKGAAAVDFRLEQKDGKVTLKARPVR
jgi:hypothetical protein